MQFAVDVADEFALKIQTIRQQFSDFSQQLVSPPSPTDNSQFPFRDSRTLTPATTSLATSLTTSSQPGSQPETARHAPHAPAPAPERADLAASRGDGALRRLGSFTSETALFVNEADDLKISEEAFNVATNLISPDVKSRLPQLKTERPNASWY